VAANVGNITPILILTKTDLVPSNSCDLLLEPYRLMGLEVILSSIKKQNPPLRLFELLSNNVSVLAGQSGTGKSSLLNAFFPDLNIKIGAVSQKTSKGSHTTTYAIMHQISENGFVIDTPGIREFGLWDISRLNLAEYYPMIQDHHNHCKHRNCRHISEPGCAVKKEIESGRIHDSLYQGYLSIYESLPN
jgi:ribosome biogenesis GTPase